MPLGDNALIYGLQQALRRKMAPPEPEEPEFGTGVAYEDRLEPLTVGLERILGENRGDRLGELYDQYEDMIDERPNPSAWRTAAAIGSSFLRPLREAGVPEMLATSPEERKWAEQTKLLGDRMASELDLAKEGMKQRSETGKALVQYGSDVVKPQVGDGYTYDPGRTDAQGNPFRSQVLAADEMMTEGGKAGAVNRKPFAFDPEQLLLQSDETVRMASSPRVEGGNVVRPSEEGGSVELAPSEEAKNQAKIDTENTIGKWKEIAERIRAGGGVQEAQIRASGDIEEAKIRGAADVASARARGSTSKTGTLAARALRDLEDKAGRLRQTVLEDVGNPEELEAAVRSLQSLFDTQAEALQLENPGIEIEPVDFTTYFGELETTEPGMIWGRNFSAEKALAAYDSAVADAKSQLTRAAQEAQASEPAAEPIEPSYSGPVLTREQAITTFTEQNGGEPPTEEDLESLRRLGVWR